MIQEEGRSGDSGAKEKDAGVVGQENMSLKNKAYLYSLSKQRVSLVVTFGVLYKILTKVFFCFNSSWLL